MVIVGLLNYAYALLLTHLLSVTAYSRFAAGQGLILWASTVATVSVPWVLAQALVRARSDAERNSAIRFAKLAGAGSGVIAAAARRYHRNAVRGLSNGARAGLQHLRHLPGHHDHWLAAGPGAHARPLGPYRRGEPAEERRRGPAGHGCRAGGHRGTWGVRDRRARHAGMVATYAARHRRNVAGRAGRPRPVAPCRPHRRGTGGSLPVRRDRRGAGRAAAWRPGPGRELPS